MYFERLFLSNSFARAQWGLTLAQQKAIYFIIHLVNDSASKNHYRHRCFDANKSLVLVFLKDFFNALNVKGKSKQKTWINIFLNLENVCFCINKKEIKPFIKINSNKHFVLIRMHEDLIDCIVNLNNNYTKQPLLPALKMKSKYSINIFRNLSIKLNFQEKVHVFDLSEIKTILGCKNKYIYQNNFKIADFERKTLIKAKKEINEITECWLEFKRIKKKKEIKYLIYFAQKESNLSNEKLGIEKINQFLKN